MEACQTGKKIRKLRGLKVGKKFNENWDDDPEPGHAVKMEIRTNHGGHERPRKGYLEYAFTDGNHLHLNLQTRHENGYSLIRHASKEDAAKHTEMMSKLMAKHAGRTTVSVNGEGGIPGTATIHHAATKFFGGDGYATPRKYSHLAHS